MAAPQDAPEQGFRLRKFQGTQTEMDSTFIGPSYLVSSENWIPTQSYRLGKRPGSTLVQSFNGITLTNLLAAHNSAGVLYLYAYGYNATIGSVFQMIDEAAFTTNPPIPPAGSNWLSGNRVGRMVQFRDRIYAGNGYDPLISWKIGDPSANTLRFVGIADDGLSPTTTSDVPTPAPANPIPTGTYSYCWGRFNLVTGVYTGRTQPNTVNVLPNEAARHFPLPTASLQANEVWRLFVSPRNYPIEYATMQVDKLPGANPVATEAVLTTIDVTDTRVPMAAGINIFRTGNMFLVWSNRVVFAGSTRTDLDPTAPCAVYATDVILPGLEQSAFNQGTLFPDFAKVPLPDVVTGIGVAGITSDYSPISPLVFFTIDRTFLVTGDPFDPAGQAEMIELSSRIGCVGHDSIVNTPAGLIFCGLDSIYLIPPGGGYPQDIGWPIADQIRAIPAAQRRAICATFNKQFYKIAIPSSSGTTNTVQWWLDLRGGIGQVPAWWGPHSGLTVTAMTGDPESSFEIDRCYSAVPGLTSTSLLRTHQLGTFTDQIPDQAVPIPIRSRLRSGRFDADQPFLVKIVTRLRLISQTAGLTYLHVILTTDGGVQWTLDPIVLGQDMSPPGQFVHLTPIPNAPPNQRFNTLALRGFATFGSVSPAEVQTIAPYVRPRGLSIQVLLTHDPELDAVAAGPGNQPFFGGVELRDFELLFLISGRKVRYLNERISK